MQIGVNGLFLSQPGTGSGQYARNLLWAMCEVNSKYRWSLFHPEGRLLRATPSELETCLDPMRKPNLGAATGNWEKLWFEQVGFPRGCAKADVTICHVPYFAPPLRPGTVTVVTVHDLIPLLFPEYQRAVLVRLYNRLIARAITQTDALIADSQKSKDDIVAHLDVPAERVHVIHLGVEGRYRPVEDDGRVRAVRRKYRLPERFVLYLGGFDRRKNVQTLIEAYAKAAPGSGDGYPLVLAGRLPKKDSRLFPDPRRWVKRLGLKNMVKFIGWVAEEDKPTLYSAARLFIFPSRYEGFGLPPLEAMACGTPVVASNASSLPEVLGEAALTVSPDDVEALAGAMNSALRKPDIWSELRRRGLEQAERFSWEETARQTLAVYHQALEAPK